MNFTLRTLHLLFFVFALEGLSAQNTLPVIDSAAVITRFNDVGIVYTKRNRLDSAAMFFKQASDLNTSLNGIRKNVQNAITCKNIGDYFIAKRDMDSAIIYYHQSVIQLVTDFNEQDLRLNPYVFDSTLSVRELLNVLSIKAKTLTLRYQDRRNKNDLVSSINAYSTLYRLINYVIENSTREQSAKLLFNLKHILGSEPVANSLKLFEITGDSVFLRHAFRFDENNKSLGRAFAPVRVEDVRELQSSIPPGYGVLSYHLGDTLLVGFLVKKNNISHFAQTIDTTFFHDVKEMNEKVRVQDAKSKARVAQLSKKLHQHLIDPFDKELNKGAKLMIIPDGALYNLSFGALQGSKGSKLSDVHTIAYSKSSSVLTEGVWAGNNFENDGSEQSYLVWIMIAAACVLGGIILLRLRRS